MPKRSRSVSMSGRTSKKSKTSKRLLKKTDKHGDIVLANMDRFSTSFANPRVVRRLCRFLRNPISGGTTTGAGGGFSWQLSDYTQYNDLLVNFDQYRIVAAELEFTPYSNVAQKSTDIQGRLFTCLDMDDITAPASHDEVCAFTNSEITPFSKTVSRRCEPRVATALYGGSLFTSFGNSKSQWIDAASVSVPHYGLKYWIDNSTTTSSNWFVTGVMYVELRAQR